MEPAGIAITLAELKHMAADAAAAGVPDSTTLTITPVEYIQDGQTVCSILASCSTGDGEPVYIGEYEEAAECRS